MSTQEFISSGILEAYVTGAATDAERAQVEAMAAQHPEVKTELQAIEDAMNAYVLKHAVEPPARLRDKIMDAIASTPTRASSGDGEIKEYRIGPRTEEKKDYRYTRIYAIAASLLLLLSLPASIFMYMRMKTDEGKITAMAKQQQDMAKSMNDSAIAYQGMRNKIYVLTDPMFKMIPLKGMAAAPGAKAMACWCPGSKELYFEPEKLPEPPKGMQYQLWAIVDGKPVDAGMVKMEAGMQKMKLIANASAFAVTLEKAGGSPTPHGDTYVMGTI